ncbi:hypothetical protein H0H93_000626 [Arthromyces matolae]|nr:hypothetical protein H0H93_000626 [Arthromyces matolae]
MRSVLLLIPITLALGAFAVALPDENSNRNPYHQNGRPVPYPNRPPLPDRDYVPPVHPPAGEAPVNPYNRGGRAVPYPDRPPLPDNPPPRRGIPRKNRLPEDHERPLNRRDFAPEYEYLFARDDPPNNSKGKVSFATSDPMDPKDIPGQDKNKLAVPVRKYDTGVATLPGGNAKPRRLPGSAYTRAGDRKGESIPPRRDNPDRERW